MNELPSTNIQDFNIEDETLLTESFQVVRLFTKVSSQLYQKQRICEVKLKSDDDSKSKKCLTIKSDFSGIVQKILVKVGDIITPGEGLLSVKVCTHPTQLGNICCDCGLIIEEDDNVVSTNVSTHQPSIAMLHSIPDLKVSKQEAERLGAEDITNLLVQKKLTLLVDLDQTLIHTTNDDVPPNLKDVYHFQLAKNGPWYHTRMRPYTKRFLENISKLYELHICTFGIREYAHYIAHFLDPERKLFGHRILSRNECLDPMSKKGNLTSLFPCGDNMVCIIDDRCDVWNFSPNVIQVLPYHFFKHTGDINAPPGLQKNENDDTKGFDFSELENKNKKEDQDEHSDNTPSSSENSPSSTSSEDSRDSDITEKESTSNKNESDQSRTKEKSDNNSEKETNLNEEKDNSTKEIKISEENNSTKETKTSDSPDNTISDTAIDSITDNKNCDVDSDPDSKFKNSSNESDSTWTEKLNASNGSINNDTTDVHDPDDYLLYLEDILVKLQRDFYENYTPEKYEKNPNSLPDLKQIIPDTKKKVLDGVNIVFSGVIPTHHSVPKSKAYLIATQLGAKVSERLVVKSKGSTKDNSNYTTHVVAANLHTEKVHQAKRSKHIHIVMPNWLWSCAERWEKVDERLFILTKETEVDVKRAPPHHCLHNYKKFFPEEEGNFNINSYIEEEVEEMPCSSSGRQRTESGSLIESINPMAFFSNDDTKKMEDEVNQILSDEDDLDDSKLDESSESELDIDPLDADQNQHLKRPLTDEEEENDDDEDNDNKRKKFRPISASGKETDEDELPSVKFRQGGGLPSDDSDDLQNSDDDDEDMGELGDILERELMS